MNKSKGFVTASTLSPHRSATPAGIVCMALALASATLLIRAVSFL